LSNAATIWALTASDPVSTANSGVVSAPPNASWTVVPAGGAVVFGGPGMKPPGQVVWPAQNDGVRPEHEFMPGLLAFPETNPDGDWQLTPSARTGLLTTVMRTGAAETPACSSRRRPALWTAPTLDVSPALPGFLGLLGESVIRIPIHLGDPWGRTGLIPSSHITRRRSFVVNRCPTHNPHLGARPSPVGRIYMKSVSGPFAN